MNTHAWAVLLGHVTGFAAVNAWSSVQQVIPRAFCPAVPVAAYLGISCIYGAWTFLEGGVVLWSRSASSCCNYIPSKILPCYTSAGTTARWRYERTMADGEEDEYEEIGGECAAETEDEVISLSVSFLIAQVLLGPYTESYVLQVRGKMSKAI